MRTPEDGGTDLSSGVFPRGGTEGSGVSLWLCRSLEQAEEERD